MSSIGTKELWPILTALTFVPVLVHLGLFYAAESPKYLYINQNNKAKAEKGKLIFNNYQPSSPLNISLQKFDASFLNYSNII